MTELQSLGQSLRKHRLSNNLTIQELARRAKVSPSFISMLETGKRNPTLLLIWRLSFEAGVRISVLLQDAEQLLG